MRYSLLGKGLVWCAIILFVAPSVLPIVSGVEKNTGTYSGEQTNDSISDKSMLDVQYIYNITRSLSNIIFTEYNESNGEIAKGRAFGTKGEHKAADILFENMTKLGLYTYKEQITNTKKYPELTHELEVVDYNLKINDRKVDCYIAPVWYENSENNYDLNFTYNYSDLKVVRPPLFPNFYKIKNLIFDKQPFVLILKDMNFYSDYLFLRLFPFLNNFAFQYCIIRKLQIGLPLIYSWRWNNYFDYCKGIILYDFNKDTYDMNLMKKNSRIPFIFINGTEGNYILDNIDNIHIDFKLKQQLNTSVVSYDVIGQLNGTDPSKTVIIDCLYDSWWCQGTADSAIGMAMVLAIAKYFKEHDITPKYNIKFIAFGGEEHGFCAGSNYYESAHPSENIPYVIDLNQLGYRQDDPKLTLDIIGNKLNFLNEIWKIIEKTDYEHRVDSSRGVQKLLLKNGGPSNSNPFATSRSDCKTVCFLKDGGWKFHHRDGLNHTEGDVLKYFDPVDVAVTGELILNVTKYLVVNEI